MKRTNALTLILVIVLGPIATFAAEQPVDYNRQIRPLLSNHCFKCHGPDAGQRKAGFRLDVRESAIAAADSGKVPIVPHEAAKSELLRRINAAGDLSDHDHRNQRQSCPFNQHYIGDEFF